MSRMVIFVLVLLAFAALPLSATVTKCGVGTDISLSHCKSVCTQNGGVYTVTGWFDKEQTRPATATCALARVVTHPKLRTDMTAKTKPVNKSTSKPKSNQ